LATTTGIHFDEDTCAFIDFILIVLINRKNSVQPKIKIFPDNSAVANAFAADFVELLQTLTLSQPKVTVSLSGGSTPKLLFEVLAKEFKESVEWSKVHFFWGDERCVPPTDQESNFGEAERLFLSKIDIPIENIHRVHGEADPADERISYSQTIEENVGRNENGTPSFDVLLLGMGDDGHTASIFPAEIEFLTSDRICEVATHPLSGQQRITVTGQIINASKHVFFLVTGASKANVLSEIIDQTGDYQSYPTFHISPAGGSTFYVDHAAAAKISNVG
jgi:6-phosphogluconolactonase